MLKRELKINFKPFSIFTILMTSIYLISFLIYPSISNANMDLDALIESLPKEISKSFNMDSISISTISGWIKTEGYMIITLFGSIFFGILGGNILLKEENDGTIYFLATKPIKRSKIVVSKIVCGIIYILIFNLLLSIFILAGLKISNDLIMKDIIKIAVASALLHLFIFILSIAISTFFKKTRNSTSTCIGTILIFYIITILANLNENINFLKYLTPFSYVDISISSQSTIINLFILSIATFIPLIITFIQYSKKELV